MPLGRYIQRRAVEVAQDVLVAGQPIKEWIRPVCDAQAVSRGDGFCMTRQLLDGEQLTPNGRTVFRVVRGYAEPESGLIAIRFSRGSPIVPSTKNWRN